MKRAPILDPVFTWHSSASHDAGSEAFRERQRARMKAAQEAAKANTDEAATKIHTIARKVKA